MKGYKGFELNMTCRGFQYAIGETYTTDKPILLCVRGFHFCKHIEDCFNYYAYDTSIFAEVEAIGDVIEGPDGSKCVTNAIKIIRLLSPLEIKYLIDARRTYASLTGAYSE